jgi:hypothetical protein
MSGGQRELPFKCVHQWAIVLDNFPFYTFVRLSVVNRLINLIALAALAVAFSVGANALYEAWRSVAPWEHEWAVIPGKEPKHTSEQLLAGIQKANEVGAFNDANILEAALRADFLQTGKVYVRFTDSELLGAATSFSAALLLLLIPVSLNYLRHGKFRLWNRNA